MTRNPFHYLYVGERVSAAEFTDIFSTGLVQHALPLFQPGNVVLVGANGMGKSMLFNLFQPEVRLAYASAGKPFPVDEGAGRFIAAGINVNTAKCNEFGHRRTLEGDHVQELMFGDFFNYYVVADILRTIECLGSNDQIARQLGLRFDQLRADAVATSIAVDPAWYGYLGENKSFSELRLSIDARINSYRRYMNGNDQILDERVAKSKTSPGEPINMVVRALRNGGLIPTDIPFYIIVDQYEELGTISSADNQKADYRSVVNKILNGRDSTVSYRIGTRGYGWRDHTNIFGTDARLEQERDYKLVELESRLRRSEYSRTSVFNEFARDVFRRRIEHAAKTEEGVDASLKLADVFGRSLSPVEEARIVSGPAGPGRRTILEMEPDWPAGIVADLIKLLQDDPLSARLGEAWLRQKGADESALDHPWEAKTYWRKERNEVALLQIAGRKQQRAVYCGEEDILALSGGNILIFLSICQLIWDFASQASRRGDRQPELPISRDVQTIGIIRAGRTWLDRIPSEYGRSHARSRLVQKMGEKFAEILLSDRRLSNPGQNGISLSMEDLESHREIRSILIEATDYGNLVMSEHANRSGRSRRLKFYLNPLYCPIFRIPFQRTKEPLYLTITALANWLREAAIIDTQSVQRISPQLSDAPLLDLIENAQ